MGRIKIAAFMVLLVSAAVVVEKSAAATYVVGDTMGWTIPTAGASSYASWAAQHTFRPGDILVFNFQIGAHSVGKVDKASFDSCSATNPTTLLTISPANLTLSGGGTEYFICTFGQHCSLAQKLAINVSSPPTASAPATPSSAPAPASSPSSSMSPSGAPSPGPSSGSSSPPPPAPEPDGGAGSSPGVSPTSGSPSPPSPSSAPIIITPTSSSTTLMILVSIALIVI